jgi:hypothetical protein
MTKEAFTHSVIAKAKELKITPKLLLFAVVALSEKPDATEQDVFPSYFKSLVDDMKQAAEEQTKSPNKKRREAGEESLKEMDAVVLKMVRLLASAINLQLPENEPILNLHNVAISHLANDRLKLHRISMKLYRISMKLRVKVPELDSIRTIKRLCPGLVEKAKEFAGMFNESDLNLN